MFCWRVGGGGIIIIVAEAVVVFAATVVRVVSPTSPFCATASISISLAFSTNFVITTGCSYRTNIEFSNTLKVK